MHVDDAIITGTDGFIEAYFGHMGSRFVYGSITYNEFDYLGLEITRSGSDVITSQSKYAKGIKRMQNPDRGADDSTEVIPVSR